MSLPESVASVLLKGLGNNIQCPICTIDMTLGSIYILQCQCRFILCISCCNEMNYTCPQRCKSIQDEINKLSEARNYIESGNCDKGIECYESISENNPD